MFIFIDIIDGVFVKTFKEIDALTMEVEENGCTMKVEGDGKNAYFYLGDDDNAIKHRKRKMADIIRRGYRSRHGNPDHVEVIDIEQIMNIMEQDDSSKRQ